MEKMDVIELINNIENELISEFKIEVSKGIEEADLAGALTDVIVQYYMNRSLN